MSNRLEELKQKRLTLQKEMLDEAKSVFKEESAFLFKENPVLKSFAWRQYTPYWCDGDTCEFSAHIDSPTINGQNEYGENEGDDICDEATFEKLEKPVGKFLSQFDEDMLKDMFGDHCEVIVSEKEVVVESYEHE